MHYLCKKNIEMKRLFTWAVALFSLILSSCGDDEIVPAISNEYRNDSLPSFVVEALNNARLICGDSIGVINDAFTKNYNTWQFKDDHENNINVDEVGNVVIKSPNNSPKQYINWDVRESKVVPDDTIHNTVWIGKTIMVHQIPTTPSFIYKELFYNMLKQTGAEYEDSTYENIETYRYEDITGYNELRFNNSTCLLTSLDTLWNYDYTYNRKYRKVKVNKKQTLTIDDQIYMVTFSSQDNTVYLCELEFKNGKNAKDGYRIVNVYSTELDSDNTFTIVEESDLIKKELINIDTQESSTAYNYRLTDSNLFIYKGDDKHRIDYEDGSLVIFKSFIDSSNNKHSKKILLKQMR